MRINCLVCGLALQDEAACPNCQQNVAALDPAPDRCPVTDVLSLPLSVEQITALATPQAWVVLRNGNQAWRVRWVSGAAWEYWRPHVVHRITCSCEALPPCRYVEQQTGAWVVTETTNFPAQPWSATLSGPQQELRGLLSFAKSLAKALESLHAQDLLWLNFDPQCLEEIPSGGLDDHEPDLRFTNLDLRLFPAGQCPDHPPARPAFAAPEIWHWQKLTLGPRTDVFHFAMFCYYWLARLLPDGFAGQGLSAFRYQMPPLRILAPMLPTGIAVVLEKGLAVNPRDRFATVAECFDALRQVAHHAEERRACTTPVNWDIGWCSLVGAAKEAVQKPNEDFVLIREFAEPGRALVAVADGVSLCDVGNGALASRLATMIVDNCFDAKTHADVFGRQLTLACLRSAKTLLEWAVEQGFQDALRAGKHLMATTLTAGWLQDNCLHLGNLGDSRAYLIENGQAEQLTVDGDLRSSLLGLRLPPEEVQLMGHMGRALRYCIGGCTLDMFGNLIAPETHCKPMISTWPLCPGDVVVLCTDGLVEEEAFLEPAELAQIVTENLHRSAEEIAVKLGSAANARHRLPSLFEPDGFGDNISCVVVKVLAAT
jgi:serine/threonine protein phosphatase PrpC